MRNRTGGDDGLKGMLRAALGVKKPSTKVPPIHIKASHVGRLHEDLGVAKGTPIPTAKLDAAKSSAGPAERKRIQFAENARRWSR